MNYQLVIQFPVKDACADDFDRLIMIENELGIALGKKHDIEGHELGATEMNIFIHTNDPIEAFVLAKNVFSEKELKTITALYRDFDGEKYQVIWPENLMGEFLIN